MSNERRDHVDIVRGGVPIERHTAITGSQILTGEAILKVVEVWEKPAEPERTPKPGSFTAEMAAMEELLGL